MANMLWTQVLGAMHLARIRVGMRQAAPGIPELFDVEPERVVQTCVASALAIVGAQPCPDSVSDSLACDTDGSKYAAVRPAG